jgi:hypothetical protein
MSTTVTATRHSSAPRRGGPPGDVVAPEGWWNAYDYNIFSPTRTFKNGEMVVGARSDGVLAC